MICGYFGFSTRINTKLNANQKSREVKSVSGDRAAKTKRQNREQEQ